MPAKKTYKKAYVVTVDMGYGHQRAVNPLKHIAVCPDGCETGHEQIITANNYDGIPARDRRMWEGGRSIYETISRMKHLPVVGDYIFGVMDYLQRIEPFYPRRDLSSPTLQVQQIYSMIKKGWGKDLIDRLNKKPLPYFTAFFTTAFFAEEHGYEGPIYCLCTDTDISRAWVPLDPQHSRITYLAPTKRVVDRLQEYGIKRENIIATGFPLPKNNIGGRDMKRLKESLGCRLSNLDPHGKYIRKYQKTLDHYLGKQYCKLSSRHPLTITFAVGGAGAQRELGGVILESLHKKIDSGEIRLNLVAGARKDVYTYFSNIVNKLHISKRHKNNVNIIYSPDKMEYFALFDDALLTTDILWTKPSELSFYAGLGMPIIMSPSIGSQEDFNRQWLHAIGAGMEQEDPRYTHEWLYDWLDSGWLAQAAMEGFMDAPRLGTYNVQDAVLTGKCAEIADTHLL